MVRGKVQMKRIENASSRQVTFSKRRNGLLKKAYELSVLCDAEVALIIFSQKGRLYEFSSSNMQKTIERYREHTKDQQVINDTEIQQYAQQLKQESAYMAKKIELLEVSQRRLLGQGLGSCSMEELHEIGSHMERSLKNIRERKDQLFKEQIEELKEKERFLLEQNEKLCGKCAGLEPWQQPEKQTEIGTCSQSSERSDVETELFIGLPEMRC
ncbi:MADS-box protein AGL42-like [Cornus florida]|uniref:MADS-box protein AGL42-like n=1 Tax=Cornus florida TaxID=4283 RepID=UPI002899F32F|nr:MADS-box protein AGL42-like [Cornus florida]XP_059629393.1 MADS-box protein AGL42-like [Cornus florida]